MTNKPLARSFSFDYFGSQITGRPRGTSWIPDVTQVITAHCVPLTADGKVVAVDIIGRGVDIPGGHVEVGEATDVALRREIREEASVTIANPVLIDVVELSSANTALGLADRPYMLLYAAKVNAIDAFTPNAEVAQRYILAPVDFVARYFGDKQYARTLVDLVLAAIEIFGRSRRTLATQQEVLPITFVETQQTKEGVQSDIYTFDNDTTRDLAIVHVTKGYKTPLQRILKGTKTIEGYMSGEGALTITALDGSIKQYGFAKDIPNPQTEIEVKIGELMQWSAATDLVFYEICEPPYEDGRFENLPE